MPGNSNLSFISYRFVLAITYQFTGATIANGNGTGSGQVFEKGITHVVVTALSSCNQANIGFDVTVVDNIAPVAVCKPATIYLDATGNAALTAADINNGSSDNCGAISLSVENTGIICGTAAEGSNITLTAPAGTVITAINFASYGTPNGSCGNFSLGTCHAANSVSVVSGLAIGRNTVTIAATNITFGDPCVNIVKRLYIQATYSGFVSSNTFNCSKRGNNTVVLKVTDAAGNVSTCNAVVTVLDTIHPVIQCPANITVQATGVAGAVVNYSTAAGTDNCAGVAIARIAGPASGATFPVGVTTVTYKATDASGNTAECSFTVTVNGRAPQIVCPANITVNNTAGQCTLL